MFAQNLSSTYGETAQKTALLLTVILTYFDISKNRKPTPFDWCFFDAFLTKNYVKWSIITISIQSELVLR